MTDLMHASADTEALPTEHPKWILIEFAGDEEDEG